MKMGWYEVPRPSNLALSQVLRGRECHGVSKTADQSGSAATATILTTEIGMRKCRNSDKF